MNLDCANKIKISCRGRVELIDHDDDNSCSLVQGLLFSLCPLLVSTLVCCTPPFYHPPG